MFNIIFVMIIVIVDLLSVVGFEVKSLEIGTSGTIPCDHVGNDPDVRVVQWYKSRNISAFVNGDLSLASWTKGVSESLQNNRYHIENTSFSLAIDNTTLEDEGLYKCSVERGDLYTESYFLTRTVMYALPRMDPKITLDLTLNRVNCTVEHVKPLIYPVFNFNYSRASTETYVVLHEDETYTTSISYALPQTNSASRVDCSISYLHYQRVASLDLPDITTESLMGKTITTVSPVGTSVTYACGGCTCTTISHAAIIGVLFVTTMLGLAFIILIRLSRRIRHWWVPNCNEAKESEEKMRTRFMA